MPREVVHIQVGQCGNQIGTKFWETIAQEHGLSPEGVYIGNNSVQLEKIDVYYHETSAGQFVPRGVLVDMENSVLNHITSRTYGKMFRPSNFLSTTEGAANNFMVGRYGADSLELCNRVHEILRREVERTQCCQGFTFTHASSGGTGSGLTMAIYEKCTAELLTPTFGGVYFFTLFPSTKISNTVTEPYNTTMTLFNQKVVENVVCFDNESLYKICFNTLGLDTPTFGDLNRLVSMVMSGNTASFRFPGQINTDLNKLSYSLRSIGHCHFYTPSFAPLTALKNQPYRQITVSELVKQMTDENNYMVDCSDCEGLSEEDYNKAQGCSFSYAALFRGNMTCQQVDEALSFLRGNNANTGMMEEDLRTTIGYAPRMNKMLADLKNRHRYFSANSRPGFCSITSYAPPGMPMSCTFINNTSNIKFKFLNIIKQADMMSKVNAFTHWFKVDGPSDMTELPAALKMLKDEWISEFGVVDETGYPSAESLAEEIDD